VIISDLGTDYAWWNEKLVDTLKMDELGIIADLGVYVVV
jgi:hypothetical protein